MSQEFASQDVLTQMYESIRDKRLLDARSIFLSEGVDSRSSRRVIADLLILDQDSHEPINLFLNSPGGEINSGFAIYDTIRFIKSDVRIITAGLCASIATIINIATKKENRLSLPNGKFLIHQPLIMGHVQGSASDLEITANQILKSREKINKLLAEECKQPLDRVEKDTTRDYWMTAPEALEYGLINRIITSVDDLA
ncbi:MAG: ATP-dependent Clp protease proteolytic subunit [Oligoflexales bacterium]